MNKNIVKLSVGELRKVLQNSKNKTLEIGSMSSEILQFGIKILIPECNIKNKDDYYTFYDKNELRFFLDIRDVVNAEVLNYCNATQYLMLSLQNHAQLHICVF